MPATTKRKHPPRTPGKPFAHRGCGRQVMEFQTQYGGTVLLDVEPVEPKLPLARYQIDWDASPPQAFTVKWQSHVPPDTSKPMYSCHFDTCPARTS